MALAVTVIALVSTVSTFAIQGAASPVVLPATALQPAISAGSGSTPWAAEGGCSPDNSQVCVPLLAGYPAPKNLDPNMVTCARDGGTAGGCEALFGTDPDAGTFYVWANDGYGEPNIAQDTVGWEWSNGTWTNVTTGSNARVFGYDLLYGNGQEYMVWDPQEGGFVAVVGNGSNTHGGPGAYPAWTFLYRDGRWSNQSYEVPVDLFAGAGHGDYNFRLVWDPALNEIVLVTGSDAAGPTTAIRDSPQDFTWVFQGTGWTNVSGQSVIPNLYTEGDLGLAWDPSDREVVLEGATNYWAAGHSLALATTYTFSSAGWANRTPTWSGTCSGAVGSPCVPSTPEPPGYDGGQFVSTWGDGVVELGGDNLSQTCYWSPYVWYWQGNRWSNISSQGYWPLAGNCGGDGPLRIYDPITNQYDRSGDYWGALGGQIGPDTILTFGGSGLFGSFFADAMNTTLWCLGSLAGCSFPLPPSWTDQNGLPCSAVRLEWSNPTPPIGTTLVNDTVYVYSANGTIARKIGTGGPATELVVYGLACGSMYSFSVQSWYSSGVSGPLSGAIAFLTADAAGSSGFLSAVGGLTWFDWAAMAAAVTAGTVVVFALTRQGRRRGREIARQDGG